MKLPNTRAYTTENRITVSVRRAAAGQREVFRFGRVIGLVEQRSDKKWYSYPPKNAAKGLSLTLGGAIEHLLAYYEGEN
jgi:hypothetical protein